MTLSFFNPSQFHPGGPCGPPLSLSGLIQLVVRCRAAFWPVMIAIRVGEQTLIA